MSWASACDNKINPSVAVNPDRLGFDKESKSSPLRDDQKANRRLRCGKADSGKSGTDEQKGSAISQTLQFVSERQAEHS
jgi:hypothetical protein